MKILVLGATGMLGNAVFRLFSESKEYEVYGSVRSNDALRFFSDQLRKHIITNIDVEDIDRLMHLFTAVRPDVVINCIGMIKQLESSNNPLEIIPLNAIFPHRLEKLCQFSKSRLIHMSTDCIFSGKKGGYTEGDVSDALDLYGRSKYMGEVEGENSITLRTSIIGHELAGKRSLIDWFLGQSSSVKGYRRAIFSGLPTVELARVIRDYVIPHPELRGVYHVSANPINKFELLMQVAKAYEKKIEIVADDEVSIDRSLDSTRFREATGFTSKSWPELIDSMKKFG